VALGFPVGNVLQMIGADAIIGWVSGGTASVSPYHLEDKVDSRVVANTQLSLMATSATEVGGTTTIFFTRPLMAGFNPIADPRACPIIASSKGESDGIGYHGSCRVQQAYLLNLIDGGGAAGSSRVEDPLRDAHGSLMLVGWGVMLVAGVIFARYGKGLGGDWWFQLHQIFQVTGFLMVSAGFTIAWIMVDGFHFNTDFHGQLGLTIMILAYFQFFGGLLRPHKGKDGHRSACRKLFEFIHPWNGRFVLLLACINIFSGISIWFPWWVYLIYALICAFWVLVILFCEFTGTGKKVEEDAYHAL